MEVYFRPLVFYIRCCLGMLAKKNKKTTMSDSETQYSYPPGTYVVNPVLAQLKKNPNKHTDK